MSQHDRYISPFSTRYSSDEMQYIFSDDNKFRTWRRLWVALARAEMEQGLTNITPDMVAELEAHVDDINYEVAIEREKLVRHDVMSHVYAYGQQCPKAAGIIHLGATSCYVGDNTDIIVMRQGLELVRKKLIGVLAKLGRFAEEYKDMPCMAYTHCQPAQPTTVGKRETEFERLQRIQLEKALSAQLKVMIPDEITVGELAARLKQQAGKVIAKFMQMGEMHAINDVIDFDTASLLAEEFHAKVEHEVHVTIEERLFTQEEDSQEDLVERPPVVCVMGHVDHGKTSILDAIRKTNVTAGEAGGITQAIGAYQVKVNDSLITFLDTPGHEAFTSMRARGANMTDIAVLVVAADDGIMPQTIESINHAKAANVKIIVAMNKMDKPTANPERVMEGLTKYGIITEDWGGDVACIPVSALTGMGINDLLERIALEAEVMELKANPNRRAKGAVVEARLDKGQGPIATILVQNGTLHSGDVIIRSEEHTSELQSH